VRWKKNAVGENRVEWRRVKGFSVCCVGNAGGDGGELPAASAGLDDVSAVQLQESETKEPERGKTMPCKKSIREI
jgi:hypothetical protein